jgi:hypothetical protein
MNNLKQHFSYPLDWKVDAATLKRWMENASEELYALILQGAGYTGILEFFHDVATNRKYNLSADPVGCIDNFRRAFQYANMRAGGHIVDLNRQHMARFSEDGPTRAELAGCLRDQLFQLTLIAAVVTSDNNHTASDLEETLRAIARRTCSLYGASYDELEEAMPLDLASVSREALYAIRNPQRGVDLGWDNGPLSCPGLVAFAETMAMRIAQVQQPASTTAQVDTIESRRAAVTDAGAAVSMRDAKVRVLCGVTQDMDMSRVRNILSEANRVLKKKGYGQLDGEQDFRTFNMPVGESGSMNQAAIESGIIDSIDTKMGEDETLVIFVPRIKGVCDIDTSPGSDFVQRCLAKHANTIIVPDAYADSIANPETRRMVINGHQVKTYPDIIARMMIGRILAWMKAAPSEEATNALLDYLGKISPQAQKVELAGVKNLEDILKKLNETALRIMPIDYTDLENFRDSQIATAVSA